MFISKNKYMTLKISNVGIFVVGDMSDSYLAWNHKNHVQNTQHQTSFLHLSNCIVHGILYSQSNLHLDVDLFKKKIYEMLF